MRPPRTRGPKLQNAANLHGPRLGCLLLLAPVGLLVACDREPVVRVYDAPVDRTPAVATAPTSGAPAADPAAQGLAWTLPDGWTDTGESNAFRTATLVTGEGEARVEVAVSRVPGQAGSIQANVNRWRGQLGLPPMGRDGVIAAVEPAPTGENGLSGMDVTLANPDADPPAAQRIAWFDRPDGTWYVKASGTPEAIDRTTPAFNRLLASLRPAETP